MLKFGALRVLALLVFGIAVPYALFKLSRATGQARLIAGAAAAGVAYGALKADNPWSGDGLSSNLQLMAVSAAVLAGYVGLSVAAAGAIAKRRR